MDGALGDRPLAVGRGAIILVFAQGIRAVSLLLGVVVLSRLLTPNDFGSVAVAVALVGLGEILRDAGLSTAAVARRDLTSKQRDNLFWLSVLLGLVLALIFIAAAGWIATQFSSSVLGDALPVMAVVFVFGGIGAQYRADLNRVMRFRSLALVDSIAPAIGVVAAILAALAGAGSWALVVQVLVASFTTMVLLVVCGRWRARRPNDLSGSWPIMKFGVHISIAQIVAYLGNNVDTLALGYWSTPAQLGFYNRSFQLAVQVPGLLRDPATTVALPILSQRVGRPERLLSAALGAQRVLGMTVVPFAGLLAGTAPWLVSVALGGSWSAIHPLVAVLSVAAALQVLASVAAWLFTAIHDGVSLLRYSTFSFLVKATIILVLARFGAIGVAWGFLLAVALMWPIALNWACRRAGLPVRPFLRQVGKWLTLGAIAGLGARMGGELAFRLLANDWAALAGGLLLGALVLVASLTLRSFRSDVFGVWTAVRGTGWRRRSGDEPKSP